MTIGSKILEWSADSPRWQRVGLRMLTEVDALTEEQVDTLAAIALQDAGRAAPFGDTANCAEISGANLGSMAEGRGRVRLLAVRDALNVNRLAPDQQLEFAPIGLTIVYGPNGAGKSGYARILKRTCGARRSGGRILPNVYDPSAVGATASAVLEYSVDDTAERIGWTDVDGATPVLPEIALFDAQCGHVHVSEQNAVLFTPAGLDLLERLTGVCERVRFRLRAYLVELDEAAPLPFLPEEFRGTVAQTMLDSLSPKTDVEQLRVTVSLPESEQAELTRLQAEEAGNTEAIVSRCTLIDRSLEPAHAGVTALVEALTGEALEQRAERVLALRRATEAAELASKEIFAAEPLPDVGGDVWRALWEAARTYSQEKAYPSTPFPVVSEGAVCPLCLRTLDKVSAARFVRFEEHVRAEAERVLLQVRHALEEGDKPWYESRKRLMSARVNIPALRHEYPDLAAEVARLIEVVEVEGAHPNEDTAPKVRAEAEAVAAAIAATRASLAATKAAAEASNDPDRAKARRSRILELRSRQWLAGQMEAVAARVPVLSAVAAVRSADDSCDTGAPSRFVTKLAEEFVTQKYQESFAAELKALKVKLPLVLTRTATHKGVAYHQVQLAPAPKTELPLVLSEGEQKCIALAAFLAEADARSDASGLVFDDPVTSLDHRWRNSVAGRLVREGQTRQVVVFTHDIVFLMALLEDCEKARQTPRTIRLAYGTGTVGVCVDGLPWSGMGVKQRIGVLRQRAQQAGAVYRKVGYDAYAEQAAKIYGLMRETWERGVEEVLLNGAIVRLRRGVEAQRLAKLTDIAPEDLQPVEEGMSKCSTFMDGHDEAAGLQEEVPLPDELDADIAALDAWVTSLRPRRE